ncbi:acyl-CoA dehydrogenase [Pseudonocardia kujensis]|uniref:acyl-CoA dehydrogenase n=1 Tax=Pseudonocardia kujensis TaxID=1128675 RepID=UPI001E3EF070|nr:acyl-CoA dehydrogenase [Pseudonocardia kujensis]MCE0762906.1 acyl-CoA dehydrogenase [Pseudonocardia kujensis]
MPRGDRDLILSRRDVHFLLHDWLHVEELTKRERFAEHSRETVDAVLELAADLAAEKFAPHNKRNDAEEPRFVDGRVVLHEEVAPALRAAADAGLLSATMDAAVGGLQLPHVVGTAVQAWLHAANIGTWAYAMLTVANANLLLAHGTPEQVATWVPPMLEGRFHGTMCLSEPQAGSSLADITTRAEPRPDGSYRLRGTKMWISGGEHELGENIVHLVLAKIPGGAAGVKGISLFLVPKFLENGERNDVALVGLNHKMGYRGTVNTLLNLGEGAHTPGGEPGAVGYLVGAAGGGLAAMFHMMNEARIGVGAGAAALAYTGYLKALDYARTRPQGRPAGAKDPAAPMVPIVRHADVRRMLLAQKAYAEGALALVLYCGLLVDEERTAPTEAERVRAHLLLETLTPIAKSWPSQWGPEANSLAIQVHGGYGYTREYDVEQHYRDNRLNPIHEGTHGIQAADLLGRKVVLAGGAGFTALQETLSATIARAAGAGGDAAEYGGALRAALDRLVEVTAVLHADPDAEERLANASVYLEAAGHVVVAWIWLEQLLAAAGRDDDLGHGKRAAARYFFRFELPKVGPQLDLLASLDRTSLDTDPSWL